MLQTTDYTTEEVRYAKTRLEDGVVMVQGVDERQEAGIQSTNRTASLLNQLMGTGVSASWIAEQIGVTRMTIHRWRRGLSHPRPAILVDKELVNLLKNRIIV